MLSEQHRPQHTVTPPVVQKVKPKAGGLSGAFSSIASQPFDVIKTNMIGMRKNDATGAKQLRMIPTTRAIVANEGILGLWRGTVPTFWRVLPGAAIYYSLLNQFKEVSQYVPKQYRNESIENFIVGASARSVATFVMNPATVIKTRFEVAHLHPEQQTFKNAGVVQTFINIYKTEGLRRGLFSGVLPTLARDVPYAGLSFVFYSKTKSLLTTFFMLSDDSKHSITSTETPWYITLTSGAVGGMLGSAATYPFDVVRTRLQLKSKYTSVYNAFSTIIREEGFSTLFRGMVPRLLKRSLASALSWSALESVVNFIDFRTSR